MKNYLFKSNIKKLKGIYITKNALKKINSEFNSNKKINIKINIKKTGCAGFKYFLKKYNKIKEKDIIFFKKNINIIVSKNEIKFIDGIKIDFIQEKFKNIFKFFHKNIKNTCGCGESFQIKNIF
ncbi:Protein SufA [Buchnera aphidicola (Periphyllus testudinaceus)]|uniref:HesB/IscA family protein n=1 Tax=Buchnera aphidicola TaxID=9 RepID=UPI0034640B46